MKKVLLLVLLITCFKLIAAAQNCGDDFLGTKTLYKAGAEKYTKVPAGYSPVFINHVGRHGARHLTKDVKTTSAYALLFKADSLNALTENGKKLKAMVIALQKVEKGNTKFISAEGKEELKGLGERMYANYPGVFSGKLNLNVGLTKEVRTKQSADAFLGGLTATLKDTAATHQYNDDTDLRFYDLSPVYKKFENGVDKSELMLSLKKDLHLEELSKDVTGRFFSADYIKGLTAAEQEKFVSDLFGFATVVYSLQAEIKQAGFDSLDFKSFFTCEELQKLSISDSADEDLKKGPGADNNGVQVRIAVPLLVNFINTTDAFIKGGKYIAELRFAHAETIAPLAALLQIAEADKASDDAQKLNAVWQSAKVIPLSSNIQWVFYKKKGSAQYLVKVLFNEKEVSISGLNVKSSPYYKWDDFRALYVNKLTKLGVKLTDDMNSYLTDLK